MLSNMVDLNKPSSMVCEITESDDAVTVAPEWFKSSTKVRQRDQDMIRKAKG